LDFQNHSVEARAFALPKIINSDGKNYIPVVTAMHQGRAAAGTGDEGKIPVAAGAVVAGKDDVHQADAWKSGAHKKPEENKAFPQRVIILLDISGSMYGDNFDLVKKKILDLKNILEEKHIETVLLPYDHKLKKATTHYESNSVFDKINSLEADGGTDIYNPIDAVYQIAGNDDKRTMALLISDGIHESGPYSEAQIIDHAKNFSSVDAGVYTIGVGPNYKENLMRGILESAGFGGAVHIPEVKGGQEVFKTLLPEFIRGVSSAPHFPVFKFNQWFDKVINLTPSMRPVAKEADKFKAVSGYQNDAYNVAFIEEGKFDKAGVSIDVKDKANGKAFESWDLDIEDFDQAIGLDPSERELIKKMPLEALKVELMKKRDVGSMQNFTRLNSHTLDPRGLDSLADATQTIMSFTAGDIDEDDMRSQVGSMDSMIGGQSVYLRNPVQQDIGLDETVRNAERDYTVFMSPRDDGFEGPESISLSQADEDNFGKAFGIMKKLGSPEISLKDPIDPDQPYKLFFKDGDRISIGRGHDSDLMLLSKKVSRLHAEIFMEKGRLYIIDKGSKNGTKINDKKLVPGEKVLVTDEDKIKLGDATIKIVQAKQA
jgi:Mg-chelatase subunit ChlD